MQIHTVARPIEQRAKFDAEVNTMLADGWTLKKRETVKSAGEISEAFNAPTVLLLYAELERVHPYSVEACRRSGSGRARLARR